MEPKTSFLDFLHPSRLGEKLAKRDVELDIKKENILAAEEEKRLSANGEEESGKLKEETQRAWMGNFVDVSHGFLKPRMQTKVEEIKVDNEEKMLLVSVSEDLSLLFDLKKEALKIMSVNEEFRKKLSKVISMGISTKEKIKRVKKLEKGFETYNKRNQEYK